MRGEGGRALTLASFFRVVQVPGALYRGVLIKGLIALTNRRLFIYAFIPPAESVNKVIKSGPVTIHFPGRLQRQRRVRSLSADLANESTLNSTLDSAG
jgi:hypothetical protein